MSFKITPSSNRILDPFAVFCIILGVFGISVRAYQALHPLTDSARHMAYSLTLVGASVVALVYSLVALRNRLSSSWADRALYVFSPLMFLTVGGLVWLFIL